MGLLDDAIREHLELKRLRGADPGEVAREQHEALDPVPRDERPAPDLDLEGVEDVRSEAIVDESPPVGDRYTPDQAPAPAGRAEETENSDDLQTAELDMRTLLDEDPGTPASKSSPASHSGARPMQDGAEAPGDDESLEWEIPGDSADRLATDRGGDPREEVRQQPRDPVLEPPGQERLRFDQRTAGESELEG